MLALLVVIAIVTSLFLIYLTIYFIFINPNAFFNKLTRKTLWMWLPFYALWRLTREIFLDKR